MFFEAAKYLGRAPSSSEQSIEIGPQHRTGVIQTKNWIEPAPLEFSLSNNTSPLALERTVLTIRKVLTDIGLVVRILIRLNQRIFGHTGFELLKKLPTLAFSVIRAMAVFLARSLGQKALGRHTRDAKTQDQSSLLLYRQSEGDRLTFAMFKGFHIVKLHRRDKFPLPKLIHPTLRFER